MCSSSHKYFKEYGMLSLASIISVLLNDLLFYAYYLVPNDQLIIDTLGKTFHNHFLVVDKIHSLLDLLLQVGKHLVKPLLLIGTELSKGEDFGNTILIEAAGTGKVGGIRQLTLHIGALDDALLSAKGLQHILREQISSVRHRQSRRSGTGLGLDDLVTTELRANGKLLQILIRERRIGYLREQRQDGNAGMSADDGHIDVGRIPALILGNERIGTAHIEGGNTAHLGLVVNSSLLQDLGGNWDGRVDGVGNDGKNGLGTELGATLHQRFNDTGLYILFVWIIWI